MRNSTRSVVLGAFLCVLVAAGPKNCLAAEVAPRAATTKAIELLPLIILDRDRIAGKWSLNDGDLTAAKEAEPVRLQLPGRVPAEYVLEVAASREAVDKPHPALVIGLVVGDHVGTLIIDAEQRSALWPVDGKSWQDNPTTTPPAWQFKDDTPGTVRCTVKKNHVLVEFDGRKLIDFTGEFSRLGAGWESARRDRLFLGSLGGHKFSRVTLTPLTAAEPSSDLSAEVADTDAPSVLDQPATEAAQAKIRASMRQQFARAVEPAQKIALAQQLRRMALESANAVERLALQNEAQQQALEGGKPAMAIEILDAVAAEFGANRLELSADVLESIDAEAGAYLNRREVIKLVIPRAREALITGQVELGRRFMLLAQASAKLVNDRTLSGQFERQAQFLGEIAAAEAKAAPAKKKLKSASTDGDANLEMGRFLCLLAGDWKSGLPHLVLGSDKPLAAAAEQDLKTPAEPVAKMETADRWRQLAEQEKGLAAEQLQARANYWYQLAVPGLQGLNRAKIEKRLTEIAVDVPQVRFANKAAGTAADVFLCELAPEEVRIHPEASLLFKPVVVGEIESPDSFLLHPTSQGSAHAAFSLPGGHQWFAGKVGLNDSVVPSPGRPGSPLTFRVVGDGQLLWQSRPLETRGDSQKFTTAVGGVGRLELFVDCPGNESYAHAAWINCALTNNPRKKPRLRSVAAAKFPKFEVLEAKWGGGNNWADLTDKFRPLGTGTSLVASSDLAKMSDPTPGWKKNLRIKYRSGEQEAESWFGENQPVVLGPGIPAPAEARKAGLVIGKAGYGAGYIWLDMTQVLRSRVTGPQLKLRVDGSALDLKEDPVVGARKTLYVYYWFNGEPHLAVYHDGDQFALGQDQ